ncbi:MAG: UDP-2,3-diacylglucosamine diphosphatase [Marinoscillum sp.]
MNSQFSELPSHKKVFVASDFHLGSPDHATSQKRERKIIRWLTSIQSEAQAIILAGDLFDFWFEYGEVVPRGYIRFLGKLAELKDQGVEIIVFIGNHDLWMFDYFPNELGIPIIRKPESFRIGKNTMLIGHGDGLGPGDRKFKFFKKIFSNKVAQWFFKWAHPDIGIPLAKAWSDSSKNREEPFEGEQERIFQHCKKVESTTHHDYYIFGHRHLVLNMPIAENSTYLNMGEWITDSHYIEIDSNSVTLRKFED